MVRCLKKIFWRLLFFLYIITYNACQLQKQIVIKHIQWIIIGSGGKNRKWKLRRTCSIYLVHVYVMTVCLHVYVILWHVCLHVYVMRDDVCVYMCVYVMTCVFTCICNDVRVIVRTTSHCLSDYWYIDIMILILSVLSWICC